MTYLILVHRSDDFNTDFIVREVFNNPSAAKKYAEKMDCVVRLNDWVEIYSIDCANKLNIVLTGKMRGMRWSDESEDDF